MPTYVANLPASLAPSLDAKSSYSGFDFRSFCGTRILHLKHFLYCVRGAYTVDCEQSSFSLQ